MLWITFLRYKNNFYIARFSFFLYFIGMNILLTNDDGYFSIGIKLLQKKLAKYGKVVVVAPKQVMSAKSTSITIGVPMEVIKVAEDVFACDGSPADCVAFALSSMDTKFDLVVSGCNNGFNISYDIIYSGTVGACLQALTYRVPALAISAEGNFQIVDDYFDMVMEYIIKNNMLSKESMLNVNFPLGEKVEKIVETKVYYRPETTYYVKQSENHFLALRDIHDKDCLEKGSDVYEVHHHNVSITRLDRIADRR